MDDAARSTDPGSWKTWHSEQETLRLGVSACLLGQEVRYDGGHKRTAFVADDLGRWFEWVPVCPEVEVGMGVPRPVIWLAADGEHTRLVVRSSGEDYTRRMTTYAEKRVRELGALDLDGYILKKDSPSCGMERVRVHHESGRVTRDGVGMFARALMRRHPSLPVEEEGRLNDPHIRETFIERVFCRNRWRTLRRRGLTRRRLIDFHTAHKLLLRSHNDAGYRLLGKLVGDAGRMPDRELFARYESEFARVLKTRSTRGRHTNVLLHALGYLKRQLDAGEKGAILDAIEDYRAELLPLVVPLTLLRFNIRKHRVDYLLGQLYFDPHPKELMLRNRV